MVVTIESLTFDEFGRASGRDGKWTSPSGFGLALTGRGLNGSSEKGQIFSG